MTKPLAILLVFGLANVFIWDVVVGGPLALAAHIAAFYAGHYASRVFP